MDVASTEPRTYDIDEAAVIETPRALHNAYWLLAGLHLTPELRQKWHLPSEADEQSGIVAPVNGVRIPNTHHDYSVAGGYLVPYYIPNHETLANRSETRIISRSRAFFQNAEPQLGISRTKEEIDHLFHRFAEHSAQVDPTDSGAMNELCGEFRQLFGAIMTRFEQLGRAIEQGNTDGTTIRFPHMDENRTGSTALTSEQIEILHNEYTKYWNTLTDWKFLPLLRLVRLTDKKPDYDGVLIDLMREIGKPIETKKVSEEYWFDSNIVTKIGNAMHSIDQVHELMRTAMTEGESGKVFYKLAQSFIKSKGAEYHLKEPEDILRKLGDYTALCRARCGIRADDAAGFDPIYTKQSALEDFFNSTSGFLETLRDQPLEPEGAKSWRPANAKLQGEQIASTELETMRYLLIRGVKLMSRTAYTHIPCNASAPEVWIPDFNSNDPIEAHMAKTLPSPAEKEHARRCLNAAEMLPKKDQEKYLQARLCSIGRLEAGFQALEATLSKGQSVVR